MRHNDEAVPRILIVSTHAPAWGATLMSILYLVSAPRFNPRARMGRDSPGSCGCCAPSVSTHAPAWGATGKGYDLLGSTMKFQPTRPHGARQPSVRSTERRFCFNPRARMGRDSLRSTKMNVTQVSTHAPAWGATPCSSRDAQVLLVSTHAPAWGATPACHDQSGFWLFQPTRPHGARRPSVR